MTLDRVNNTPPSTGLDGSGAFVATLYQGSADFYFGGTVSPYSWVTNHDYVSCDFSAAIDVAPGSGNAWKLRAEYALLSPGQNCSDITIWRATDLCTISGANKSCSVNGVPVHIVGPACLRGHAITNGSPLARGGGTASFHCYDSTSEGPMHFQGSGRTKINAGVFYGGNVFRSTNIDRAYWISPGMPLQSCGGVVALPNAPGAGNMWHIQIASSKTALSSGQNCADLAYNHTSDVCTISGATQKQCNWKPIPLDVPEGGCMQIQGTCTGGTCATMTTGPNYGIDCSTSNTSPYNAGGPTYETAGSGAFDSRHRFGVGPWAISDAKPQNGNATLGQQYWRAPSAGLSGCAGAFTFENVTGGTGQYDIGLRTSTTAPTSKQSCLDLNYIDTAPLCIMRVGEKSCRFPLTSFAIPGNACFALIVKTSNGTPTNSGQFNWQASCIVNTLPDITPPSAQTGLKMLQY